MKYGRLIFSREFVSPTVCNMGDIAQTFAIDLIYKEMGILPEDIIDISIKELSTYQGEKVVLPLDGYFRYSKEYPAFPTSKDIIPVFLGIYSTSNAYLKHSEFWNKYAPIGCRDEATLEAMRKKGYEAYLTGCMTMVYPKRKVEPDKRKVFIVDAYPGALEYMPEDIKKDAEYISHDIPVNAEDDDILVAKKCQEISAQIYRRYCEEATLVVTSRLHCAAPCIAMGIPTIVVKDGFDERFGWLDKFVHLYSSDEFSSIDWNPTPVDLEEHKKLLMLNAIEMIKLNADKAKLKEIHEYYMNRDKKKLSASILVRGYMWLGQYNPKLAGFIREKVLKSFTITSKTNK